MFEWLRFWKQSPDRPAPARAARPRPADDPATAGLPPELRGPVRRLGDNETWVRRNAAEELGRLGPAARPAIPALVRAAVDVEEPVRKSAAAALEKIDPDWPAGPEAEHAAPALVKALGSRFTDVWQTASFLLGRIGKPAVAPLLDALADRWQDTRQAVVARTLGRIGPAAAEAVPALAHELGSEHGHVREAAAEALAQIGPAAEPAVPALVRLLTDRPSASRQAAALALAKVGRSAPVTVVALVQLLPDRADEVRETAVEALAKLGPDAVPCLVEMLRAADAKAMEEWLRARAAAAEVKGLGGASWCFAHAVAEHQRLETARESAVRVLGQIGPDAAAAVGVLAEAVCDRNRKVRLAAVRALGAIGPAARPALAAVVKALAEPDPVRKSAAEALPKIDPNWAGSPELAGAVATLAADLNRTGEIGQGAADALVAVGSAAVPALVRALASGDRIEREAAATTLGRLGPAAREAVPALRGALQDPHSWVRDAAARALRAIEPDAGA